MSENSCCDAIANTTLCCNYQQVGSYHTTLFSMEGVCVRAFGKWEGKGEGARGEVCGEELERAGVCSFFLSFFLSLCAEFQPQ